MRISSFRNLAFSGAALVLLCLGCASKPTSGGPGTYRGVLVGVGEMGTLDVTVGEAASGPLLADGEIVFLDSTTTSLSGAVDRSGATISLASTMGYQFTGDSRPGYAYGAYRGPLGSGEFALLQEPAGGDSIRTFCGSYVSTTSTTTSPIPFAIAGVPEGSAMCVGPNFAWLGYLDADDIVSCSVGTGLFYGNANADAGNHWGTGTYNGDSGTWTVVPCGGGTSPGPDGGASGAADAAL
jgi:hypothetical protein